MKKDKKGFNWDGRTRVVTDSYRKNFDEIFKKKVLDGEDPFETNKRELRESYEQSLRNKKERENNEEEKYLRELKDKL
jgi:hypothetical protein|tara:strand:+ start:577 stop:810 length:234 start_codon:yes stop_codon:yes gene_type:complete